MKQYGVKLFQIIHFIYFENYLTLTLHNLQSIPSYYSTTVFLFGAFWFWIEIMYHVSIMYLLLATMDWYDDLFINDQVMKAWRKWNNAQE